MLKHSPDGFIMSPLKFMLRQIEVSSNSWHFLANIPCFLLIKVHIDHFRTAHILMKIICLSSEKQVDRQNIIIVSLFWTEIKSPDHYNNVFSQSIVVVVWRAWDSRGFSQVTLKTLRSLYFNYICQLPLLNEHNWKFRENTERTAKPLNSQRSGEAKRKHQG